MTQKEITICGHEIKMLYCAATENGFERITKKSTSVFVPTFGKDEKGELVVTAPPTATTEDYLSLAIAAIVAAYSYNDEEPPIDSKNILYEATPDEVKLLLNTIIDLRNEWYGIPKIVEDTLKKEAEEQKDSAEEPVKN